MSIAYGAQQPCDRGRMLCDGTPVPCPQRDKPWVLFVAILGSSMAFIEGSVVNLALPSLQTHFAIASTQLQWVVNAYLLVLGSFMLIGGAAGDRFGVRRVFVLGTVVFGVGSLLAAQAPELSWLLAARLVQGLGGALLVPSSLALISTHFSAHERGRAIGAWASASALTTALGPLIGGWLVDRYAWPAVFYIVPPVALLTVFLSLWRVPRSVTVDGRVDYAGGLLLALACGAFIYALVVDAGVATRAAIFALALAAAVLFVWREHRVKAPMLPLELFRSRAFSGSNAMTLLLYGALSGALFFLPFNLIQVQGFSALEAGAAFLPFTLLLGFGSRFAGSLLGSVSPRTLLSSGAFVAGLGFVALALPGRDAAYFSGFFPGIALIGVGMTASVAPLTTVVMNAVSDAQAGVASGVNNTAARLAGVFAVAAMSVLAVSVFSAALESRLDALALAPDRVGALLADADKLAELAPANGDADILAAIDAAFVTAFRSVTVLCGVLAMCGSAIAWFSLRATAPLEEP